MVKKKFIKKMLAATLAVGSLTFIPEIYHFPQISSISYAEIREYIGVGEYIMSKKETPDFAEQNAKMYAERNAQEQAGVFLSSLTEVKNNIVERDEITTFAAGILKITKIDVEAIPLAGESSGYIKYRVTVKANIDSNDIENNINQWLSRSSEERTKLTNQDKNTQKTISDLQNRISELENKLKNAKTSQDMEKIQEESEAIDKDALKAQYAQKLDEANLLVAQKDYVEAFKLYNEILKINPNDDVVYMKRGDMFIESKDCHKAIDDYYKAIKINPHNNSYYTAIGNICWTLSLKGEQPLAVDYLNKVLEIAPDNQNIAITYVNMAQCYEFVRDYINAINFFEKALEIYPEGNVKHSVYNNKSRFYIKLSQLYKNLGNNKKANEYSITAATINPKKCGKIKIWKE